MKLLLWSLVVWLRAPAGICGGGGECVSPRGRGEEEEEVLTQENFVFLKSEL